MQNLVIFYLHVLVNFRLTAGFLCVRNDLLYVNSDAVEYSGQSEQVNGGRGRKMVMLLKICYKIH